MSKDSRFSDYQYINGLIKQNGAAFILKGLHRLFPYYGSSFYAKGKVVKRTPPKNPTNITIDIIRQCSFGCEFCFASDVQQKGDYTEFEKLQPLFDELKGMEKITLIGGEPFEHPQIVRILKSALETVEKEVEIFTNGKIIPETFEAAEKWLEGLVENSSDKKLKLTLATDKWHKKRHGTKRFEQLVETLLKLERMGRIRLMFNVTDESIKTEFYLALPTIRKTIADLSPVLLEHFEEKLKVLDIEESFYLNPLIAQGRQDLDENTELLRVVDFIYHPEIVVTEKEGKLILVSSLNAIWMKEIPEGLIIGEYDKGKLAELFFYRICDKWLEFENDEFLKIAFLSYLFADKEQQLLTDLKLSLDKTVGAGNAGRLLYGCIKDNKAEYAFKAYKIYKQYCSIVADSDKYFDKLALKMLGYITTPEKSEVIFACMGREDFDQIRLLGMKKLVEKKMPVIEICEVIENAVSVLKDILEDDGDFVPCLITAKQTLGNMPEEGKVAVPVAQTGLDLGFSVWPREDARYLVFPQLLVLDGEMQFYLKDVKAVKMKLNEKAWEENLMQLVEYFFCLFYDVAKEEFLQVLRNLSEKEKYHKIIKEAEEKYIKVVVNRNKNDMRKYLRYVSFDPSLNREVIDNKCLTQLLVDSD